MKKKVIAVLVVLAVLIGGALYASWAHTPVLELFPDGEWEGAVYQRFMEESKQDVPCEQLYEVLEDQYVWYGGGLAFLPDYIISVTIDGEDWLLGVSEGYVSVIPAEGKQNASQYRDDGTIYRLVKDLIYQNALAQEAQAAEPVASLGSLLPGQPWNSMTWERAAPYIGRYESGQYDPEDMYSLLEALPLYAAGEALAEGEKEDGYLLLVCNPDIEPLTRYTVWIGRSGGVAIENDQASDTAEPQYYRTDPEIVDTLDEMLLGYCLRDVTDIENGDTLGALLPELPWNLADWILSDEETNIQDQGKIDPAQLLELANKTALVPQDTGLDPEKKSFTLLISNPDAVPVQRCDIYIDELGNVEFRIRVAQGYLVERFYKADPSLYEALTEMLCPDEG